MGVTYAHATYGAGTYGLGAVISPRRAPHVREKPHRSAREAKARVDEFRHRSHSPGRWCAVCWGGSQPI